MQVEALRYDYMRKTKFKFKKIKKIFLITGDYNLKVNEQLENLVIRLSKIFNKRYFLSKHPNLKIGNKLKKIKNCRFFQTKVSLSCQIFVTKL